MDHVLMIFSFADSSVATPKASTPVKVEKQSKLESRNSCNDKSPASKNDSPMTPRAKRKRGGWPKGVKRGSSTNKNAGQRERPPKVKKSLEPHVRLLFIYYLKYKWPNMPVS